MAWRERPIGRSIRCNGAALRGHRARRELTQPELAALAGFTTRLIAKAEASESVHPDTIEVLAETLSTIDHPVFPEDLASTPKDIARFILECYARHERQCVRHFQHYLSEDMITTAPGDPSVLPFAGEHKSIDGFDDFFGSFFSVMERPDKKLLLKNPRLVAEGNTVVVLSHERASFCGTDVATPMPLGIVMEFERGRLTRFEDHFDIASAAETAATVLEKSQAAREQLRKITPHE